MDNDATRGWEEVKAKVGRMAGQGYAYAAWRGANKSEHGFQYKPQGTGSGETRAWVWQTGDESTGQYLRGYAAMWMDKHGQLWIPAGQVCPEGEVRAPKHGDT